MRYWLSIDKCPHGMRVISLDNEHGGTRLTTGKCCGRLDRVMSWELSASDLREIADRFECAADDAEGGGR